MLIEDFHKEYRDLIAFLEAGMQPSFVRFSQDNLRRTLVLAIASSFEHWVTSIINRTVSSRANSNLLVCNFVSRKALFRTYHTFFDWENESANPFFALFGQEFKSFMRVKIQSNKTLETAIDDFLKLGAARNRLVHLNFLEYDVQMTTDEVFERYKSACYFVEKLESFFTEFEGN